MWDGYLAKLVGRAVTDLVVFGRFPEIQLALADGWYATSFMTAEGDPEWALIDQRPDGLGTLCSKAGRLCVE